MTCENPIGWVSQNRTGAGAIPHWVKHMLPPLEVEGWKISDDVWGFGRAEDQEGAGITYWVITNGTNDKSDALDGVVALKCFIKAGKRIVNSPEWKMHSGGKHFRTTTVAVAAAEEEQVMSLVHCGFTPRDMGEFGKSADSDWPLRDWEWAYFTLDENRRGAWWQPLPPTRNAVLDKVQAINDWTNEQKEAARKEESPGDSKRRVKFVINDCHQTMETYSLHHAQRFVGESISHSTAELMAGGGKKQAISIVISDGGIWEPEE